jgi:hypothetical protein
MLKDETRSNRLVSSDALRVTALGGASLPGACPSRNAVERAPRTQTTRPACPQGEYIAPEKVEAVYSRSPFVAQVFVYGDSLKAQLVAVVVPDADVLLPWAAERGMSQDLALLCGDAAVNSAVLRSMQQEGQAAQLKGFEHVRCPFVGVVAHTGLCWLWLVVGAAPLLHTPQVHPKSHSFL